MGTLLAGKAIESGDGAEATAYPEWSLTIRPNQFGKLPSRADRIRPVPSQARPASRLTRHLRESLAHTPPNHLWAE